MDYSQATLYFLSGTGNTYRAATWLADVAAQHGVAAQMISMGKPSEESGCHTLKPRLYRGQSVPGVGGKAHFGADFVVASKCGTQRSLVGVLFPTHGFTAPWHVIRWACRQPRVREADAFVVATRAGTKLGPVHLPGMEGTAAYLVAAILALKGYRIRGTMGLDMPSNWLVVHPGFSPATATSIITRAQPKAARFMADLLAGRRRLGGWLFLLLGLALLPVSAAYLLAGRFFLSKLFFASNSCTGCGECVQHCPAQAIRLWGRKRPRPYWTFGCESCMRCLAYCPEKAVQAGHSWGVVLYFVTTVAVGVYLLGWLTPRLPWLSAVDNWWGRLLIQYVYLLASLAAAYGVFTLLVRIPVVNTLFTYTTLTRYWRRYRAPGVEAKDL